MLDYFLNLLTFMVLVAMAVTLFIGGGRGLWHKGYMAGLEACRVESVL